MIPFTQADIIRDLYNRIAELDRRQSGSDRTGLVSEVNVAEGWARVELGDDPVTGQPMLSPKISWEEPAMGGIKWHTPPKVGEQVRIRSESGDLSDARITVGSVPSDANARPHDKGDEHVREIGSTRILEKDGEVRIRATKIVLEGEVHLGAEGGNLVHRKGDADSGADVAVGSAAKVYAV